MSIEVYFEDSVCGTLVARIIDDELYQALLPALEAEATRRGLTLSEVEVELPIYVDTGAKL